MSGVRVSRVIWSVRALVYAGRTSYANCSYNFSRIDTARAKSPVIVSRSSRSLIINPVIEIQTNPIIVYR